MYLFDKTIKYDFDYREQGLITVGMMIFDSNLIQSIDGIIYNDKVEQIGIFSYKNEDLIVKQGDQLLVEKVIENILKELDTINIT